MTSVEIEPDKPGADTLCRLTVGLKNDGEAIASQLGFEVKINGQSLGVYGNQLFMYPVGAGEQAELQLYNFWTTETSRAFPDDAKLSVEVTLREAQWMDIKMEEDEEGEVEVWDPARSRRRASIDPVHHRGNDQERRHRPLARPRPDPPTPPRPGFRARSSGALCWFSKPVRSCC